MLNVVNEINPDAVHLAEQADARRRDGKLLGPLDGIPVLIKDNIATKDEMNNTAGSFALLGSKVPEDSTVAAKLRKAGAVILGKTNLSQWANFRSNHTTSGWSAYGGQCTAAYYPNQNPSGSSSGSGVASSIGLAWATLGTETSGSIVSPGSVSNLVGIKPTVGLTSRYLVVPISERQDTVGPMARTVKDAAYLLQAIAGADPKDNYTSAIPNGGKIPDYVSGLDKGALKGARLGVPVNVYVGGHVHAAVENAFDAALTEMEEAGATVVKFEFPNYEGFQRQSFYDTAEIDFLSNIRSYLSLLEKNPHGIHDLSDLIRFTKQSKLEHFPERDVDLWEQAVKFGFDNTDPRFWPLYQRNLFYGGLAGVLGAMENYTLDAILLPTEQASMLPGLIGSPLITVPLGFYPVDVEVKTTEKFGNLVNIGPNIPFGISFMGKHWDESVLINFAYAYEQMTLHRYDVLPYIQPNIEIEDVLGRKPRADL